jgi:hypothetical protein
MTHTLRETVEEAEREARGRADKLAKPRRTLRELGIAIVAATGGLVWIGGYAAGQKDTNAIPCPPVAVSRPLH